MATQAQIDANRKNAQKSTGPNTPEGKAKASRNHLSHGLTSAGFNSATVFLPFENPQEFKDLLALLLDEFQPFTLSQQILVEKMAHNQWISLRAIRIQGIALSTSIPHGFTHKDLGVLIRYQTSADRAFHKAHAELVKAQKQTEIPEIGFESQKAKEAPPKPPAATEKPAPVPPVQPDFTPMQVKLAAELGISVEELLRAA